MQLTPDTLMGKGNATKKNTDCCIRYFEGDDMNGLVNDWKWALF